MNNCISRAEVNKADKELEQQSKNMNQNTGRLDGFWCYTEHKSGMYGGCSIPHFHEDNPKPDKKWKALQSFYKFKSVLLPEFMERNKRNLGDIEAKLIKDYEGGGEK